MERKIWLKPADEENREVEIKGDFLKSDQGSVSSSVLECLYMDTPDTIFLKNNIVLMLCSGTEGLFQMAVFGNTAKDLDPEYTAPFTSGNFDFSLFPEKISDKLKKIQGGEPLTIKLALSFELRSRGLRPKTGGHLLLVKTAGCFEDEAIKGELSALAIKGADGDPTYFAENVDVIINETKLIKCPSPWIEAMRIKASGFKPAVLSGKKLKKYYSSGLMRVFSIRIFELLKAYNTAETKSFDKDTTHDLRVETRKLLSLFEAFEGTFEGQAQKYITILEAILDDTDYIRNIDILEEELDVITASQPRADFTSLQQNIAAQRSKSADKLISSCKDGTCSQRLTEIWAGIQRKRLYWETEKDERKEYDAAIIKVSEWIKTLAKLKKYGLDDPNTVHEFRIHIKKIRYTLENLEEAPKKLERAASGLKKLQDATGVVCDMNKDIRILQQTASSDPAAAYQCGFCAGVLSAGLRESRKNAYSLWKDNRGKYISIDED